jgi:glycerol uptake facilitator protein
MAERLVAEALGTFILVFVGCGAVSLTALIPFNGRFPVGEANLLLSALAFGFALFIAVLVVGRVSGAHVNPAVTLGLAVMGRFPWNEVAYYIGAQVAGAIAGALGIAAIYGKFASTFGHLGAPSLSIGTSALQGIVAEAIGTAILMLAIIATAVDRRAPAGWAALGIGFALGAAIMVLGPATGGSLNPARAFGPDLVNAFFGTPTNWGVYIICYLIGPIIGAGCAAYLYSYFAHLPRPAQEPQRADEPTETTETGEGAGAPA